MAKKSKFLKSQAENPSPARKVGLKQHWSVRHTAMERVPADTMISNQLGHWGIMDTAASVCSDARKQKRV